MINKKRKKENKKTKKLKNYVFIKIFSSVLVFFQSKLVDSVKVGFCIIA